MRTHEAPRTSSTSRLVGGPGTAKLRGRRATLLAFAVLLAGCTSRDREDEGSATGRSLGQQGGEVDPGAASGVVRLSFDDVPLGSRPAGWAQTETHSAGTPGTWAVASDDEEPNGRILRLADVENHGQTYNLLISERDFAGDLVLSVLLRADSGVEDRGGGLLWRHQPPENYYVTRWNPLEKNLRLYKVIGGERTQLASADVEADAASWHALEVRAEGPHLRVAFDGRVLLDCTDDTLSGPGRVGFWTKADAATSFDELLVEED